MAKNILDAEFDKSVLQSKKLVLVDFWAEWCGPCKQIGPTLEEISKEMSGDVEICKINIDQNTDTPTKYGIRSIPTLMLFKGGKNISTKVGALPKSALVEWIKSNI